MDAAHTPTPTIPADERGMAVIAHLSGLAGYILPLGGVIVPILIWFVKRDSRVLSSIAKQAVILNVAVFLCCLAMFGLFVTIILAPVAIVGWLVLGLAAIAFPVIGALKASDGVYYRYPVLGVAP